MIVTDIQYISDAQGNAVGVIVPISLWRELESEKETSHVLISEKMKTRLSESMKRDEGLSLEDVREKLKFDASAHEFFS